MSFCQASGTIVMIAWNTDDIDLVYGLFIYLILVKVVHEGKGTR